MMSVKNTSRKPSSGCHLTEDIQKILKSRRNIKSHKDGMITGERIKSD